MLIKLVPDATNIRFLRLRFIAAGLSVALLIASMALVMTRGLNFGIDFTGGVLMEIGFDTPPNLDALRTDINGLGLGEASLQEFGSPTEIAIRLPQQVGGEQGQQIAVDKVSTAITAAFGEDFTFRRVETVGGKVSGELVRAGTLAILIAMLLISIYIWWRFEWQFGFGALLSLVHDVGLTLGFFALTQLEFNLPIIAAILTIVGYSLNDTIVVYDRIRENLRKYRKMDIEPLLDLSVNETLARTVMTSLTMVVALASLIIFGGEVIRGFTSAMLFGVLVGTFSSIYVAAPLLIWMKVGPNSFVQRAEDGTSMAERVGS